MKPNLQILKAMCENCEICHKPCCDALHSTVINIIEELQQLKQKFKAKEWRGISSETLEEMIDLIDEILGNKK